MGRYRFLRIMICFAALMIVWPFFAHSEQTAGQTAKKPGMTGQKETGKPPRPAGAAKESKEKDEGFKAKAGKIMKGAGEEFSELGKAIKKRGADAVRGAKETWKDLTTKKKENKEN